MSEKIIQRILEIQNQRKKTQSSKENSVFEKQQQAIEATKSLTIRNLSPLTMLAYCKVIEQTKKPPIGWTTDEVAVCKQFMDKWNAVMQYAPETANIPTLSEKVSMNSLLKVDANFLQYVMSNFWQIHWKTVIVLVGTGSFLNQILLKNPNLTHEFKEPLLILNCDPDHSEFKEDEFNLYETLNSEEIEDFCLELQERFYCEEYSWEVMHDEDANKSLWRIQLFRDDRVAVEYVIAQTAWDDVVCPLFLPDAERKILVDVTNRLQKYMPPSLATTYDAVYLKTSTPLKFGNTELDVKKTRKKNRTKH